MPKPAVELTLYCYGPVNERSEAVHDVVREYGFRPSVVEGSVMEMDDYTLYVYEPFENREENTDLLDECIEHLRETFPELEVWSRRKPNKDYGNPVTDDLLIYVAPSKEVIE